MSCASRGLVPSRVLVCALAALLLPHVAAAQQLETRFEPPFVASGAGVAITGQQGWATPGGFAANRVFTYAGNAPGLPNSAAGLAQFVGGQVTGLPTRSTRAVGFVAADVWTATWDFAGAFGGVLPTSLTLGSVSLENSATQRYWAAEYQWNNPFTAASIDAMYTVFDAGGVMMPSLLPGASWQGLSAGHWYRQSTTWQFSTNQIIEVTIQDLTTGFTTVVNPVGWYLEGGLAPVRPLPTGISLNTTGAIGNALAWDNLAVSPQVQVLAVNPPSGSNGDAIIIQGTGFGTSLNDVAVAMVDGQRAYPMTVVAVAPTQITALCGPMPADALPGPIVVTRGIGIRGTMTPVATNRDIIPEDSQGVWVHRRMGDPRQGQSVLLFTPIFEPPPPGTQWFFSQVVAGNLEVSIAGDRLPNATLTLQGRMSNHLQRAGTALAETSVRLRMPGDALHTANRVAEALRAGLARDGVFVGTTITPDGFNQWRITVEQRDPLNLPLPIDVGCLHVELTDPILVTPFAIGPTTAFYQAGLINLGLAARVTGVDGSGNDGATITPALPVASDLRTTTQPITLGAVNASFTVRGWGTVDGIPDQLIGSARLLHIGGALTATADFTTIGAPMVQVDVFYNTVQTGAMTVPAGTVAQITSAGFGLPAVLGAGHFVLGDAGVWIDLDREVTVTPTLGAPVPGNQLRLRRSGGVSIVQNVQALDLASGSPGTDGGGEFQIDTGTQGGVCYANCDNSTAFPALNVSDFTCFLQRYALAETAANCDGSTSPPRLNVADFTCFLQHYALGCP